MKKKYIFISLVAFISILMLQKAMAFNWPMRNATPYQQKIRQTAGAYRRTSPDRHRFHQGIDIFPQDASDMKVYAVETPATFKTFIYAQIPIPCT